MGSNKSTDMQWYELMEERVDQAKLSGGQMAIFATSPELESFKKSGNFYQTLVDYIFVTVFDDEFQPALEWIYTEIDSANMSDHPIAQAFVSHIERLGIKEDLYKGALKKFDSDPVECAQQIANKWAFSAFEFGSDELVAFKTGLIDEFLKEWTRAKDEMELTPMQKIENFLFKNFTNSSEESKSSGDMGAYWYTQGMLASLEGEVNTAWLCMMQASTLGQVRAKTIIENSIELELKRNVVIVDNLAEYGDFVNRSLHEELKENIPWYDQKLKECHKLKKIGNTDEYIKILQEMVEHGSYAAFLMLKFNNGYFN